MYSLDPIGGYQQRLAMMLAEREQEAALIEAEKQKAQGQTSGLLGTAGSLGGAYAGKTIMSHLMGAPTSAATTTPAATTVAPIAPAAEASAPFMGVGVLPAAAIAATTYLGGKSLLDILQGNKDNSLPGKYGRLSLGIATGGLSELARKFLGQQDKWKTEADRLNDLKDSGYTIPQSLIDSMPTKGRSVDDLLNKSVANDFIGFTPTKEWVNNKFATGRNEADLRPEDVVNYSAFAEEFGKNYFDIPLEQRLAASKLALDAGAINEHHGTINFNDKLDSSLQDKIRAALGIKLAEEQQKGAEIAKAVMNFKKE